MPKGVSGIEKIDLRELNPHEEVKEENLKEVIEGIKSEKALKKPIVVDADTKVILDGHHRYEAFKVLGEKYIPCMMVKYGSEKVKVDRWGEGAITKEEVVEKGLSDDLFPAKTSKHDLSEISKETKYPVYRLV